MKRLGQFLILAAVLYVVSPSGISTSAQDMHIFDDWTVLCTTDQTCSAQTSASGRTDAETYSFRLTLLQRNKYGGRITVSINFFNAIPGDHSPLIFAIDDGSAFRFEPGEGYSRKATEFELLDQSKTNLMIEAMQTGRALYITFVSPKLRETGLAFSLSGLTPSLRRISAYFSDQVGEIEWDSRITEKGED